MERSVLFLHGFASSANSAKARFLTGHFKGMKGVRLLVMDFNPVEKDFEYLTVTGMINRLRQFVIDRDMSSPFIIASSLGCLVALHYATRFGGVEKLLLLAPALSYGSVPFTEETLSRWERDGKTSVFHYGFQKEAALRYDFHLDALRYSNPVPPPTGVTIIHGTRDEIVPPQNSREYASHYPGSVILRELDSDHGLLDSLDVIGEYAASLL